MPNAPQAPLTGPAGVLDGYSAPTLSVAELADGVPGVPGRAILIDCTVAGTVTLTYPDDTTLVLNLQANTLYEFNDAVKQFDLGTATATASNKY